MLFFWFNMKWQGMEEFHLYFLLSDYSLFRDSSSNNRSESNHEQVTQ